MACVLVASLVVEAMALAQACSADAVAVIHPPCHSHPLCSHPKPSWVARELIRINQKYGLPKRIQVDNEAYFNSKLL